MPGIIVVNSWSEYIRSGKWWVMKSDEEIYGKSRTLFDGWKFGNPEPSVFEYSPKAETHPWDYRVDVTNIKNEVLRINGYDQRKFDYYYDTKSFAFNGGTQPRQQQVTTSFNLFKEIEIVTVDNIDILKFECVNPIRRRGYNGEDVRGMWLHNFPQYVHLLDFVGHRYDDSHNPYTFHTKIAPYHGTIQYFLVAQPGEDGRSAGYIPITYVKKWMEK